MIDFQKLFFEIKIIPKNDRYAWRKLIECYYVKEDSDKTFDDLFFLIHNSSITGAEEVSVKRRSSSTLESFESYLNDICISYENTFYLNLISQMKFYLRFSVCSLMADQDVDSKVPLVINKQFVQEIYSTIVSFDSQSKKKCYYTYPDICFLCENLLQPLMIEAEKWICIELFYNANDVPKSSLENEKFQIMECRNADNRVESVLFFEGIVSTTALIDIIHSKKKKKSNQKEVVMSGPCGRGRAKISVHHDQLGNFSSSLNGKGSSKSRSDDKSISKSSAIFHLISITLHWKQIIDCLSQCFNA